MFQHDQPPSVPDPEHYGESTLRAGLWWSAVALVIVTTLAAAVYWKLSRPAAADPVQLTVLSAPQAPERPVAAAPAVRFREITEAAGITFQHFNGAYGDKLLPETMGGGCAFFDLDADGDQDLLFVNSTVWPWQAPRVAPAPTPALFENDGRGHFRDVTAGSGLDISLYGMGVAVGDYDGNGLPDVFLTGVGGNRLLQNQGGGRFVDVTEFAGVGGTISDWSSSAAFLDYDNDGDLDLFVAHYVRWSREIDFEVGYKLVGIGRAYGQPNNFPGTFPTLYRNEGDGRFTDVSAAAGIQIKNPATGQAVAKSLGLAPIDLDADGWIDVVVANDTVQNFVFHNQRDGTFKEIGASSGIAFDSYGNARGAMGIDAARFRHDGAVGIGIGNFANEMTALYAASAAGSLLFTDEAIPEGIGPASRIWLKFGLFFFDYDLDGWLDLLTANGHLEDEIAKVQESQHYAQPAQLFWNCSGIRAEGGFVPVPADKAGDDLFRPIVGRGSAFADIDGDGDLDVVLTQVGGRPLLLRNDQDLGHRWIRLQLVGSRKNPGAIGAWIKVHLGDLVIWRHVMPTRSYLSQSELPVTIGLGHADRPDRVEVLWPDGSSQTVDDFRLNAITRVRQASPDLAER
jgi:hypothetical protein